MPYVPTNDRPKLNILVEKLAASLALRITTNSSVVKEYRRAYRFILWGIRSNFNPIYKILVAIFNSLNPDAIALGKGIFNIAIKYNYELAYLGELNYAITCLLQEVPIAMVTLTEWKEELRYWLYACSVESLVKQSDGWFMPVGTAGVFADIHAEYKVRVNEAYEHIQIKKSGDCYYGPYYSRVMDVVDKTGKLIGTIKVNMTRSDNTLGLDVLPLKIVAE